MSDRDSETAPDRATRTLLGRRSRAALDCSILAGVAFFSLWFADALLLGVTAPEIMWPGLAVAFASTALMAVAVAFVAALAGAALPEIAAPAWPGRAWPWLWSGSPEEHRHRAARLLAGVIVAIAAGATGYLSAHAILLRIVQHHFAAALIAITHICLALVAIALFFPVARLIDRGLARAPATRLVPARFRRTFYAALLVAAAFAVSMAVTVAANWRNTFSHLPWRVVLGLTAAITIAALLAVFVYRPRSRRRARLGLAAIGALLGIAAVIASARLEHHHYEVRRVAFELSLSGRISHGALLWALDRDGDGHLTFLGGGDCDGSNPEVGPGRPDHPDNGVDEDCDGRDTLASDYQRVANYRLPLRRALPERPDILLITIDAVSPVALRGAPGRATPMPALSALAERSAQFTSCFAQGPSTRLSIPALMTSRWDSQIARTRSPRIPYGIAASEQLLQEILRQHGYDTTAVIPTPLFDSRRWRGLLDGFASIDRSALEKRGHNAASVTDAAIAAWEKPREKPLFLWVHYYDAHSPYEAPEGTNPAASDEELYHAELALVDRELARLLTAVNGSERQPLIIATSDHSTVFRERSHSRHRYGYDVSTATLHVPLLIAGPAVRPGRYDHPVSTLDLAPTVANLLGLAGPFRFEGVSLTPELLEGRAHRPPLLFSQFYLPENRPRGKEPLVMVALRTSRYHLIQHRETGRYQLYNWPNDYYEENDLLAGDQAPEELPALRATLAAYLFAVGSEARLEE